MTSLPFCITKSSSSPLFHQYHPVLASQVSQNHKKTGVVVIGAGLSGLAAATHLHSNKIPFLVVESSDAVGGRVRTDAVNGFLLDRGFQIFITAYPEAQKLLDYNALNLKTFYSGAKIFYKGEFHTVADPLRHFWESLKSLPNPIGSIPDKILIGWTRLRVSGISDEDIFTDAELPTLTLLRKLGFSDDVIERFFRPFFGGIFFDRDLETSSRLFNFIFKCLALGDNTLPANGIAAIPNQLAAKLPPHSILLNSKAVSLDSHERVVTLDNGEIIVAEKGVIVAVEEPQLHKLLPGKIKPPKQQGRSTVCIYFSTEEERIPVREPVLFLNGSGKGIVNNMFFATNVAPSYGPPGKGLVSVSLVGLYEEESDRELVDKVVAELSGWFGKSVVESWSHLRTYRIPYAQPNQAPNNMSLKVKEPRVEPGVYVCGDHFTSATFDGALLSGRKVVEALIRDTLL